MYKKPYFWKSPSLSNNRICVFNWRERKTNGLIFTSGFHLPAPDIGQMRYSQDPSTYDLIFDVECKAEDIENYGIMAYIDSPLVRQDVLDILKSECPDDFQAFPAVIQGINPKLPPFQLTNYYVINVTNLSGKMDMDRREKGFYIFEEDMEGHQLSRLKDEKSYIIVSPHLQKVLKKSKIYGLKFEKDDTEKWEKFKDRF